MKTETSLRRQNHLLNPILSNAWVISCSQVGKLCVQTALIICATVLIGLLFCDFGVSWDEPFHQKYGELLLQYYQSGMQDKSFLSYGNMYLYGGAFDLTAAVLSKFWPSKIFELRHLLCALVGLIGIIGTFKLARHLAGEMAGFLSAFLLFLTPSYFGHMFINPKDIPFAVGYIWSLYYMAMMVEYLPRIPFSIAAKLGIAIGLTLGVRLGGGVLVFYLILIIAVYLVLIHVFRISRSEKEEKLPVVRFLASLFVIFALAGSLMLFFCPWTQLHPLGVFLDPSKISTFDKDILVAGKYYFAWDFPFWYLPCYFFVKLPESVVFSVLTALALGIYHVLFNVKGFEIRAAQYSILGFAILFPLGFAILQKVVLYDEIRHLLFIVPCLCVLSGVVISRVLSWLVKGKGYLYFMAFALIGLSFMPQVIAIVKLHPYEYIYYNQFAGGVNGAEGRFDLDYWGTSYKETVNRLAAYLIKSDANFSKATYKVAVNGPYLSACYFFPKNFTYTENMVEADFSISFTRWGLNRLTPGKVVLKTTQCGVLLSEVHDFRPHKKICSSEIREVANE